MQYHSGRTYQKTRSRNASSTSSGKFKSCSKTSWPTWTKVQVATARSIQDLGPAAHESDAFHVNEGDSDYSAKEGNCKLKRMCVEFHDKAVKARKKLIEAENENEVLSSSLSRSSKFLTIASTECLKIIKKMQASRRLLTTKTSFSKRRSRTT